MGRVLIGVGRGCKATAGHLDSCEYKMSYGLPPCGVGGAWAVTPTEGEAVRTTTLGRTGITVSRIALGTMMLGAWGNRDHEDGERLVRTALDAGVNLVDTADMYSAGESERIVGKALKGRRDEVVLATKVHFPMGGGGNRQGNSRRWIRQAVEGACGAWTRTASTCTRSTGRIPRRTSTRRSRSCPTW